LTPDCAAEGCVLMRLPTPEESYRHLDPQTCQCTAATNANTANMIELERHWAQVVIECDSQYVQQNLCLQRDLLALQATSIRNKAAGEALTAFYTLAGLEARRHYLTLALEEVEQSLRRSERLEAADLEVEIDHAALEVQRDTMRDQLLQADFARLQLNAQLQRLLGCEICETEFYWPRFDWAPDMAPIDVAAAVDEGLVRRHDLRAVELVLCQLDKTTLRVARGVLGVVDGALGSVEPTEGWVHRLRCICCNEQELPVRCRQLALLQAETERGATAEIKNAVYEVALQQQRVAAAKQSVERRRARLAELTARRDVDRISVFELSQARGRCHEAEGQLVEQRVSLEIARVKLKQVQGLLALECGFAPRLCCEGPCCGACLR
jgi:hypothetical protein